MQTHDNLVDISPPPRGLHISLDYDCEMSLEGRNFGMAGHDLLFVGLFAFSFSVQLQLTCGTIVY